jgi:predicted ester cyclase
MKPQTSIVTRPAWGQGTYPVNLLVDTGKAAIEADFADTHTGEFAGIQPTGRAVRVPYSVIYDLRDDQISALRIYFPMSLLIEQLTS